MDMCNKTFFNDTKNLTYTVAYDPKTNKGIINAYDKSGNLVWAETFKRKKKIK